MFVKTKKNYINKKYRKNKKTKILKGGHPLKKKRSVLLSTPSNLSLPVKKNVNYSMNGERLTYTPPNLNNTNNNNMNNPVYSIVRPSTINGKKYPGYTQFNNEIRRPKNSGTSNKKQIPYLLKRLEGNESPLVKSVRAMYGL